MGRRAARKSSSRSFVAEDVAVSSVAAEERATALFDTGCEHSAAGDYASAVSAFAASAALVPDAVTLCNLGVSYERLGEIDKAVDCYSKACKLEQRDAVPRVNLGDALVRQHRYFEAAKAYLEALRLPLDEPWTVLNNLAVTYERTADPVKAEACYKKAVELRPQYDVARLNYLRMVKLRTVDDAVHRDSACHPDPVKPVDLGGGVSNDDASPPDDQKNTCASVEEEEEEDDVAGGSPVPTTAVLVLGESSSPQAGEEEDVVVASESRHHHRLEPIVAVQEEEDFDASSVARTSASRGHPCTTCSCAPYSLGGGVGGLSWLPWF